VLDKFEVLYIFLKSENNIILTPKLLSTDRDVRGVTCQFGHSPVQKPVKLVLFGDDKCVQHMNSREGYAEEYEQFNPEVATVTSHIAWE
jgi:hypothetical protein